MKRILASLCLAIAGIGAEPPLVIPKALQKDLQPLAAGEKAVSTHAPFASGDCRLCHTNADVKNPGPVLKKDNTLCLDCHDDYLKVLARKSIHAAATNRCISCHNPHNARESKLLTQNLTSLCLECHTAIKNLGLQATTKHGALSVGAQCVNCHNPHGANLEHLLAQTPAKLCLTCHGKDGLVDHQGKKLTNFKKLLAENPQHHGPVASGDCTACHNPHGFRHFRLLNQDYPPDFYSSYDPKLYALCFECHEDKAFTLPETDKLTQFRDGKRNLHFLHVNKEDLGRTCRVCHEVHASKLPHQMRAEIPYGSSGWKLKINYTRTPTGGTCAKTCHRSESYNNVSAKQDKKE